MLHHYLEFIDEESVAEAERWSQDLSAQYKELEAGTFTGMRSSVNDSNYNGSSSTSDDRCSQLKTPILFPSF